MGIGVDPSYKLHVAGNFYAYTVNTGYGNYEINSIAQYYGDQNLRTTDSPTFVRLTLSQATGTAPLTVSSTTKVTNLNADMVDGYHYSSSWPNPSNMVTGSGTANYVSKWTGPYTQGNSIIYDDGTNVGIGTSPSYKLHVNGNFYANTVNTGYGNYEVNSIAGYYGNQNLRTTDSPTFVTAKLTNLTDGYVPYHVSDTSGLANSNIYYNGTNVGIGTTSPSAQLHTTGSIRFQGAGTPAAGKVLTSSDASGNATWQPAVPSGVIVMWSGTLANIPSGWALCDGTNGTPDLRDKFVMGVSAGQDPGTTGGSTTHSHSLTNTEVFFGPSSGDSSHIDDDGGKRVTWKPGVAVELGIAYSTSTINYMSNFGSVSQDLIKDYLQIDPDVVTNAANHLPPYYKIAYIMKL
jgi:hypothetical protein